MQYRATLVNHYSRRDRYGNSYYALEYTDHVTGKTVRGTVSGNNVRMVLLHTGTPGDWDRSVLFREIDHGIRDFKRLTRDWPYAGCDGKELAEFIHRNLTQGE